MSHIPTANTVCNARESFVTRELVRLQNTVSLLSETVFALGGRLSSVLREPDPSVTNGAPTEAAHCQVSRNIAEQVGGIDIAIGTMNDILDRLEV